MVPNDKKITASAYILVGGLSRRFGSPKWKAKVNNIRMIDYSWGVCRDCTSRHVIGKTKPDGVSFPFLKDQMDIQSPVVGLLTAVNHADEDWIFLISCDLPLMTAKTIQYIWTFGDQSADAIVPLVNDYTHPTCAFYHKRILKKVRSQVEKKELRLQNILDKLQTSYVVIDEFEKEFSNMNTPSDLKTIQNDFMRGI